MATRAPDLCVRHAVWNGHRLLACDCDSEQACQTLYQAMAKLNFDRTDYSVVVKNRAPPPISWRWEIYRAGRSTCIKQSSVRFPTMATANRAGQEALKQMLDKLFS